MGGAKARGGRKGRKKEANIEAERSKSLRILSRSWECRERPNLKEPLEWTDLSNPFGPILSRPKGFEAVLISFQKILGHRSREKDSCLCNTFKM
jgi:hypothetical protein